MIPFFLYIIDAPNATRDESVEAKWEQIQQYEARENPSLSSLASSTASNSTTSTNTGTSSNTNSANDKLRSKLRKLKQQSLKKLSGFKLWSKNSQHQQQNPGVPEMGEYRLILIIIKKKFCESDNYFPFFFSLI